jgi:xylan 1,4-beta-xylosidase
MRRAFCALLLWTTALGTAHAQLAPRSVAVTVDFGDRTGPMEIGRIALGQGGLSDEPMWDSRIAEIRALRPRLIRLFVQEYFNLLPERGHPRFETLDRSVDAILKTGAKPLMCLCFKPRVLFPKVDQDVVEPTDYAEWGRLISALVTHYRERGAGIVDWEVANEPDIGESGGCPYRFRPESYVRYYRETVAAILRADPGAHVGGPALASVHSPILPTLLDACERDAIPLHFVSWHIYSSDPGQIRKTIDFARDLLRAHPGLKPETVLDEWNMDLMNPVLDPRFPPCFLLETAWQMKESGLDWSCYYQIRDTHVDPDQFAPFLSPGGTAFMARWWNWMPQFDGLFDYQNHVRPTYFAFKLLSRLTGEQVRVSSSDPAVHGFATHDATFRVDNLLLWNSSATPARVALSLDHLPAPTLMRHVMLDALAPSDDENARLRPSPAQRLTKGRHRIEVELGPRGVQSWSFEE